MERFALDQVVEGILLLQRRQNNISVEFANQSFFRSFIKEKNCNNYKELELPKIFENFEEFKRNVFISLDTNSIKNLNLHLFNSIGAKLEIFCTVTPHDHDNCCLTIRLFDQKPEGTRFCNLYQHICGLGVIGEFHEEILDIKFRWLTDTSVKRWKLSSEEDWIGKFATRDLGLETDLVNIWVENMKRTTKDSTTVFYKELKLPIFSEPCLFKCNIHYVEESEDGFPLFLMWAEDFTETKGDYHLHQKQFDDSFETYKLLNAFFQHSEVYMGTLDVIENDSDCKYLMANPSSLFLFLLTVLELLKLYRKTSNELIGKPLVKEGIETPDMIASFVNLLRQCEQAGHPISVEILHPNYGLFQCNIFQICQNRFSYVSQDLTQRQKLEERLKQQGEQLEVTVKARTLQLEEALEVKTRFLAMMSHEFRTPLSGIIGTISLLRDTNLNEDQIQTLNIAEISAAQLNRVTNDVLDFAKLEARKLTLEHLLFNLHAVVEEALEICSFDAQKKNLELVCDIDGNVPESITGDGVRLRQILVNLLSNACKFSQNAAIIIKLSTQNSKHNSMEILFCVQDSGLGIPEETKGKIFQPFTQGDLSATRKFSGTGLGLVICKQICELMGGNIWFESQEHKGSKFFFTVPVSPNAVIMGSTHVPLSCEENVLIVDQSVELLASLEKIFHLWNIPCSTVLPDDMEKKEPRLVFVDCKETMIIKQLAHKGIN